MSLCYGQRAFAATLKPHLYFLNFGLAAFFLFPARVKMALTQKEADMQMMLAAGVHLGTKNVNFQV
jgi:hypothetical protein